MDLGNLDDIRSRDPFNRLGVALALGRGLTLDPGLEDLLPQFEEHDSLSLATNELLHIDNQFDLDNLDPMGRLALCFEVAELELMILLYAAPPGSDLVGNWRGSSVTCIGKEVAEIQRLAPAIAKALPADSLPGSPSRWAVEAVTLASETYRCAVSLAGPRSGPSDDDRARCRELVQSLQRKCFEAVAVRMVVGETLPESTAKSAAEVNVAVTQQTDPAGVNRKTALAEIANRATLLRQSYPALAKMYRQQLAAIDHVREELREADTDPNESIEWHPQVESHRGMLAECDNLCEKERAELASLTRLIFRHLPDFAKCHRMLEIPPRRWHKLPEVQWGELLTALQDVQIEASQATATLVAIDPEISTVEQKPVVASVVLARPPRPRWTKKTAAAEFLRYVDEHRDILDKAMSNDRRAKKAAKKIFGRNSVARALEMPRDTVSKIPLFKTTADDLGITRGPSIGAKIGHEIAEENKSHRAGDTTAAEVERRETEALIRKAAISRKAKEHLLQALSSGDQTDDQVRETLELLQTT